MRKLLGARTPRELKYRAMRLVLRILPLLIGKDQPESKAEPLSNQLLASPATSLETRIRCRLFWKLVTSITDC